MGSIVGKEPRLVHAMPGRVRLHLPGRSSQGLRGVEAQLRQTLGVRSAEANSLTGNVLVHFDPMATDEHAILGSACALEETTGPA